MLSGLEEFENQESQVRSYVRRFPAVFSKAQGSELWDTHAKRYIDFFCGAGTLNYGHNNPHAKAALLEYIYRDGIQHSLDTATEAKAEFLAALNDLILAPRGLEYRVQFPGPTGTNAVEAACKLARKKTQRSHIVAFTRAYHGHSLGALALTANSYYHDEHYGSHNNVSHLPFDGYMDGLDSGDLLRRMLSDPSSGIPKPAAVILETVQGEGGIRVASKQWLRAVADVCKQQGVLLIVDDIQVGNGRTGPFFSFEESGIEPDIVCLSKSLGGGLPLAIVLVRPDVDVWKPGQHTGTFRGNNLAFVAATALLEYWRDDSLQKRTLKLHEVIVRRLKRLAASFPDVHAEVRGRGLIIGLDLRSGELANRVIESCFAQGLLLEASGAEDEVLKIMPALTISPELLVEGLRILESAVTHVLGNLLDSKRLASGAQEQDQVFVRESRAADCQVAKNVSPILSGADFSDNHIWASMASPFQSPFQN
ncbi:MAG: diaminobutyrate--2-oxoglutarate transaminase [Planctomycetales bacterium]|nr:diaminobutyrate--2-oxoglutarate transaminase [Planctomycetales bacterium]